MVRNQDEDLELAMAQLGDSKSPKRRSAAKKLRKKPTAWAGPALLDALREEVKDLRTWETQYHMIMALGACDYSESIEFLHSLEMQPLAPMTLIALGDVITWLEYHSTDRVDSLERWLPEAKKSPGEGGFRALLEGGFRALATHRLVIEPRLIRVFLDQWGPEEDPSVRFWLVAACPGWDPELTGAFLLSVLEQQNGDDDPIRGDTIRAAQAALKGEYVSWQPL